MKKAGNISELLGKLKNNTISKDELETLFDTLKRSETDSELKSAFDEHWHLMQKRGMLGQAEPVLKAGQFSMVLKRAQEREERELQQYQRSRKKPYKWYGAAAVIAIFISVSAYSLFNFDRNREVINQQEVVQWIERQTLRGQNMTIKLSDGSKIRLNAESKIRFPNKFNGKQRKVILEGEGFFEIAKNPDRPFVVSSGAVQTTVLGTSFNVRAYEEESMVQIAVRSGKVAVSDENQQLMLTPNQVATYNHRKKLTREERDIESLIAWKDGGFIFDQKPLEEIVKGLERMYDVDIRIDDSALKQLKITLKQKGESLTTVLNTLSKSGGFDYEIKGKKVLFKPNKL